MKKIIFCILFISLQPVVFSSNVSNERRKTCDAPYGCRHAFILEDEITEAAKQSPTQAPQITEQKSHSILFEPNKSITDSIVPNNSVDNNSFAESESNSSPRSVKSNKSIPTKPHEIIINFANSFKRSNHTI